MIHVSHTDCCPIDPSWHIQSYYLWHGCVPAWKQRLDFTGLDVKCFWFGQALSRWIDEWNWNSHLSLMPWLYNSSQKYCKTDSTEKDKLILFRFPPILSHIAFTSTMVINLGECGNGKRSKWISLKSLKGGRIGHCLLWHLKSMGGRGQELYSDQTNWLNTSVRNVSKTLW